MCKAKEEGLLNTNFITMDLETVNKGGILTPYLICWYDGYNHKSYWIGNYKNIDQLISKVLTDLCVKKNNNKTIYLHNLSHFDGIFMLKYIPLLQGENRYIKILYKDGKIILINVYYYDTDDKGKVCKRN